MTQVPGRVMLCLLLPAMAISEVRGEDASLLGSRVRVRSARLGEPQLGVLAYATPDELVITTNAAAAPLRLRRTDVAKLEISRGTRRHTLKGLLAGAVAWGAVAGLVAAFDTLDESGISEPLFVGGLLATGAGVGALVKTERWEPVPVGGAEVGIGSRRRGLEARIVVRF